MSKLHEAREDLIDVLSRRTEEAWETFLHQHLEIYDPTWAGLDRIGRTAYELGWRSGWIVAVLQSTLPHGERLGGGPEPTQPEVSG